MVLHFAVNCINERMYTVRIDAARSVPVVGACWCRERSCEDMNTGVGATIRVLFSPSLKAGDNVVPHLPFTILHLWFYILRLKSIRRKIHFIVS
jgi:hypothetical protein